MDEQERLRQQEEWLRFQAVTEPQPQEPPPDPVAEEAEQLAFTPTPPPQDIMDTAPKAVVRAYGTLERGRYWEQVHGNLLGLFRKALSNEVSPFSGLRRWGEVMAEDWDTEQAALATGTKTPKEITRLGEDTANFNQFQKHLRDHGLNLDMNLLTFMREVSGHMKSSPLGENWRGRVNPDQETDLLAAAGVQVAMAHATVPPQLREEYEASTWAAVHSQVQKEFPGYDRPASRLRREIKVLEDYLASADDVRLAAYMADDKASGTILQDWYARITGKPIVPGAELGIFENMLDPARYETHRQQQEALGATRPEEVRAAIEPVVKNLRSYYTRNWEAAKWARIGVSISPEDIQPGRPLQPLFSAPFARDAINAAQYAADNRLSFTDTYAQGMRNAQEDVFTALATQPETILGPLWKHIDDAPVTVAGGMADSTEGAPLVPRSQAWKDVDRDIRTTRDPSERFLKFITALGDNNKANDAMRAAYTDLVTKEATRYAEDQRPAILAWEKRQKTWDPEISKTIIDASYQKRAAQIEYAERAQKAIDEAPELKVITWAVGAAGHLAEKMGLRAMDQALLSPLSYIALDEGKYKGLSEVEKQLIDQPGSIGQWFNRQVGTDGLSEYWQQYYLQKKAAGQAGLGDRAFFTGAMILGGMLEMGGFALDSPAEFAMVSKILGKWHKLRDPAHTALVRAGVPRPVIAAAVLGFDPLASGKALNALLGRTPQGVRTLGVGEDYFARKLRNASPEARAKHMRMATDMFDAAAKSGFVNDANKARAAMTIFSSLVARADAKQRITAADVRPLVEAAEGMSQVVSRRLFAPYARHGASYNAAYNSFTALVENETLAREEMRVAGQLQEQFSQEPIGVTPSRLFYDAYQAYQQGSYDSWSRTLKSVLPSKWADSVLKLVDRRVASNAELPQHQIVSWEAMRRLDQTIADAHGTRNLLKDVAVSRSEIELADKNAELKSLNDQKALLESTGQKESAAYKKVLEETGAADAELAELIDFQRAAKADLARIELAIRTRGTHLRGEGLPSQFGDYAGLEDGFQMVFTKPQLKRLSGYLLDVGRFAPERLGEMGLSEAAHTQIMAAVRGLKKSDEQVGRLSRAVQIARRYALDDDWATVAKVLRTYGVKVEATKEGCIDGLDALVKDMGAKEQAAAEKATAQLQNTMTRYKAWGHEALDPDLKDAIRAVRGTVERQSELAKGKPAASVTDFLIEPFYWTGGRLSGLIVQQGESNKHEIIALAERIREDGHALSLQDQDTLAKVNTIHPSEWPDDLPAQVRSIAQRTWEMQSAVVEDARAAGVIDDAEAARLHGQGYNDRYYVSHDLLRQMQATGRTVREESLTQSVRMAQSAPLMRFMPAASSKFARVQYMDWGSGGRLKEKTFEVNEKTSPHQAVAQAKAWIAEKKKAGELRDGEYSEVIAPLSEKMAASKGLFRGSFEDRLDTLIKLRTETMRRQMFSQLASMTHMVRDRSRFKVATTDQMNWIKVDGPEWGALRGKYINKALVRTINSWTRFSKVLDAITAEASASLKAMGVMDWLGKATGKNRGEKALDWFDQFVRHNKIMANLRSWMNNIVGNLTQAYAAGINPISVDFWASGREFDNFIDKLPEIESKAAKQSREGVTGIEREFLELSRYGAWQKPVDVAGDRLNFISSKTNESLAARERKEMNRLYHQLDHWTEASERLRTYITVNGESMAPRALRDQQTRLKNFEEMRDEAATELAKRAVRWGVEDILVEGGVLTPQKGQGRRALTEAGRFIADPQKSMIRQAIASRYGAVDARFKWQTYRALRKQGLSVEAATERIAHFFQNFGGLSPFVRTLRDKRVWGAFVPGFPAEAARILWNGAREDPVRMLGIPAMVATYNAAAMFATGVAPSDLYQLGGDAGAMDYIRRLFFALHIPTPNGLVSLDLTQWTAMSPFTRSSGLLGKWSENMQGKIEESLGPLVSVPAGALMNFASNFILNTPASGSLQRYTQHTDPRTGEMLFHKQGLSELSLSYANELLQYAAPATAMSMGVDIARGVHGPTSTLTKQFPTVWERIARGLSGQNIRTMDRKDAMTRLLLKHGGKELAQTMFHEGMGKELAEYRAATNKFRDARDPEEKARLFAEAKEIARKMTTQKGVIGGQEFEWKVSEEALAERVIRDASRNIFTVIEGLPVDRAVDAARQLSTGIGRSTDPEMRHLWRTLQSDEYLKGRDEVGQLMDAAKAAYQYAEEAVHPDTRQQFTKTFAALIRRLRRVYKSAATRAPVNLMKEKLGTWERHIQTAIAQELGLIP